jgi:ATP-dependent Clp protease adaptor protein ClpS
MQLFDIRTPVLSAEGNDRGRPGRTGVGVLTRTRAVSQKPALYRVLLLNDDFTPMDFVIHVLERFFSKNKQEATEIMLQVHRRGVGVCGVYTYEVAETKVNLVIDYARKNEHPLQCTMEKE